MGKETFWVKRSKGLAWMTGRRGWDLPVFSEKQSCVERGIRKVTHKVLIISRFSYCISFSKTKNYEPIVCQYNIYKCSRTRWNHYVAPIPGVGEGYGEVDSVKFVFYRALSPSQPALAPQQPCENCVINSMLHKWLLRLHNWEREERAYGILTGLSWIKTPMHKLCSIHTLVDIKLIWQAQHTLKEGHLWLIREISTKQWLLFNFRKRCQ